MLSQFELAAKTPKEINLITCYSLEDIPHKIQGTWKDEPSGTDSSKSGEDELDRKPKKAKLQKDGQMSNSEKGLIFIVLFIQC